VAPDAHDAPARDIPPPVSETDALDHADPVAIPISNIDVGIAAALMPPALIGSPVMPVIAVIVVAISVAMPDLNRQIGACDRAVIGRRGERSGEAGA